MHQRQHPLLCDEQLSLGASTLPSGGANGVVTAKSSNERHTFWLTPHSFGIWASCRYSTPWQSAGKPAVLSLVCTNWNYGHRSVTSATFHQTPTRSRCHSFISPSHHTKPLFIFASIPADCLRLWNNTSCPCLRIGVENCVVGTLLCPQHPGLAFSTKRRAREGGGEGYS